MPPYPAKDALVGLDVDQAEGREEHLEEPASPGASERAGLGVDGGAEVADIALQGRGPQTKHYAFSIDKNVEDEGSARLRVLDKLDPDASKGGDDEGGLGFGWVGGWVGGNFGQSVSPSLSPSLPPCSPLFPPPSPPLPLFLPDPTPRLTIEQKDTNDRL